MSWVIGRLGQIEEMGETGVGEVGGGGRLLVPPPLECTYLKTEKQCRVLE